MKSVAPNRYALSIESVSSIPVNITIGVVCPHSEERINLQTSKPFNLGSSTSNKTKSG